MFLRYIPTRPICCWGSGLVEQVFGVVLVEQEVMVVVEQVVEEKEWEESCTGPSTLDEVHSTEIVSENKSEINEQLDKPSIEEDTTKEGVWTRMATKLDLDISHVEN